MLLSLTGASGAGKSTLLARLAQVEWGMPVVCVEFDSVGVPAGADTAWRHAAVEQWVRRALDEQDAGRHLLLCGQVPMGELLAAPSADRLDGIAVCVLHCAPESRAARLREHGEPEESLIHHIRFAEWFLRHSQDPLHDPDVIRIDSGAPMRWDRWQDWDRDDPRWTAQIVDTDVLTVDEAAGRVEAWVRDSVAHGGIRVGTGR